MLIVSLSCHFQEVEKKAETICDFTAATTAFEKHATTIADYADKPVVATLAPSRVGTNPDNKKCKHRSIFSN